MYDMTNDTNDTANTPEIVELDTVSLVERLIAAAHRLEDLERNLENLDDPSPAKTMARLVWGPDTEALQIYTHLGRMVTNPEVRADKVLLSRVYGAMHYLKGLLNTYIMPELAGVLSLVAGHEIVTRAQWEEAAPKLPELLQPKSYGDRLPAPAPE